MCDCCVGAAYSIQIKSKQILEGYGQTECVSAATVTTVGHYETDHVGVPLNAACIKLVDVPDMDYLVSQGKGEVLIKGSIVFKGYYKDPKKTQATIDQDGWLYTGDIGKFNEVCNVASLIIIS